MAEKVGQSNHRLHTLDLTTLVLNQQIIMHTVAVFFFFLEFNVKSANAGYHLVLQKIKVQSFMLLIQSKKKIGCNL